MSRGGYRGKENFPHKFDICPWCGKKGLYERGSDRGREQACRYCHKWRMKPK